MGDSSDGMCSKCGRDIEDDGSGGLCLRCRAIPALSVAKVKLRYLSLGMDVATPEFENAQYDLLVRDSADGRWYSVQVKTAYNGRVNTCRPNATGRRPYSPYEVDQIAVVDGLSIYVLPLALCNNGGTMSMEDISARFQELGA